MSSVGTSVGSSIGKDNDEEFLLRKPSSLYSVWDTAGVKGLQRYNQMFQYYAPKLAKNAVFNENWANCQRATVYFEQKVSDYWNKKRKLGEKYMTADPATLEEVWDCCEIDTLCDMRREFAENREKLEDNDNFRRNWQNCDVAIKFIEEDLAARFMAIDPQMPLKRAIREKKFVNVWGSMADNPRELHALANQKDEIIASMANMKRCDPTDPNSDPIPIEWCDELTMLYDSVPHELRPYVSLQSGLNKVPF